MKFKDIKVGKVYTYKDENGTMLLEASEVLPAGNFSYNEYIFLILNSTKGYEGNFNFRSGDENDEIKGLKELK